MGEWLVGRLMVGCGDAAVIPNDELRNERMVAMNENYQWGGTNWRDADAFGTPSLLKRKGKHTQMIGNWSLSHENRSMKGRI
jgi:hypothetical protein